LRPIRELSRFPSLDEHFQHVHAVPHGVLSTSNFLRFEARTLYLFFRRNSAVNNSVHWENRIVCLSTFTPILSFEKRASTLDIGCLVIALFLAELVKIQQEFCQCLELNLKIEIVARPYF